MPKQENYSEAETVKLVAGYEAVEGGYDAEQAFIMQFDAETGKGVRSIRAKLVREGVYNKAATVSKVTNATPAKKDDMAEKLVALVGSVTIGDKVLCLNAQSLEKMNKTDIQIIDTVIRAAKLAEFEAMQAEVVEDAEVAETSEDETGSEK